MMSIIILRSIIVDLVTKSNKNIPLIERNRSARGMSLISSQVSPATNRLVPALALPQVADLSLVQPVQE